MAYAGDENTRIVAFALAGRLFRADLVSGSVEEVPAAGPVLDPRPDPTGQRIAYVSEGALRVVDGEGNDQVLAAEDGVTWIHYYVTPDRKRTFCVYDAPTPEAVRRVANRNKLPVDRITEVRVLDPYFYR